MSPMPSSRGRQTETGGERSRRPEPLPAGLATGGQPGPGRERTGYSDTAV